MAVITQTDELEIESIPVMDPVTEILHKAANYIEEHGWVQGRETEGEKRCIVASMIEAAGIELYRNFDDSPELVKAIERVTYKVCPDIPFSVLTNTNKMSAPMCGLVSWNDRQERTKEEVIEILRTA